MDLDRTSAPSIQTRILKGGLSVIALPAVVLILAIGALTAMALRAGHVREVQLQAASLAEMLVSPLAQGDAEAVGTVLERSHSVAGGSRLAVFSTAGTVVAQLAEPDAGVLPASPPAEGADVDFAEVRVGRAVVRDGQRLGLVALTSSFAGVHHQMLVLAVALLAVLAVLLAAARKLLQRLAAQVVEPLDQLARVADAVARSTERPQRADEQGPQEVVHLARTFNAMVDTLQRKATGLDQRLREQEATEAHLDYLAHFDQVTGLANRTQFHKELPRAAERAKRHDSNIAVVFLDLDDFKVVNDTLGHNVGDLLLCSVAERLTASLRKGDFVCRLGGDEFTLILEGITSLRTAVYVVSKLIDVLAKVHDIEGHSLRIGVSAGIALYPVQTENLDDLLRYADIAMYQAKAAGKNDYRVFTSDLVSQAHDRLSIEADLRRGIQNEEFFLVYQPQIDIHNGRVVGAEALLRWQHPTLGLVSPDYFIDVAEKSGLIVPLGRQVIAMACQQLQLWRSQGLELLKLAVNVSGRQLREENFADELLAAMSAAGGPPPPLELEITESMLLSDTQVSKAMFHRLVAHGIEWSLDDFGTGYSSLTYLAKFPIRKIKIDRSFVARVPGDENSEAIVKAIIAMAQGLGMKVVIEGVETRQQVDYLAAFGNVAAQGYFYHRPLDVPTITDVLRRQLPADAEPETATMPRS